MPFQPGQPRPENAGRKAGTPNKPTQELKELAEKLGVNPFEILLHFAKGDYEALGLPESVVASYTKDGDPLPKPSISPELRQKSAKDACEYLFPKLKQVEHTGDTPAASLLDALLKRSNDSK
jgi:hypothetical protein